MMNNDSAIKLNFDTACRFMAQQAFLQAIEYFERTKQGGVYTPDTMRNIAWSNFRLAEESMYKNKREDAEKRLELAEEFYREAGKAFLELKEEKRSRELIERVEMRIKDCRKRVSDVRCYREFLERRAEFEAFQKDKSRRTITESGALPVSAILEIEEKTYAD